MTELSSGKPPFYDRKHDLSLALGIWKDIKTAFEEADEEIPYISTSYEKNPDAIYTSRLFIFNILTKPVNSSIMTSYLEENNEVKRRCW
ncbi:unnamed protein product [Rhizophagus irregularis]|nr:unnamed protein product [Rhizophagus irregularis]